MIEIPDLQTSSSPTLLLPWQHGNLLEKGRSHTTKMPLKSKDAEKLLGILWDVKMENLRVKEEDKEHPILQEEEHTLSKAISMLHCYVTDITPSFHSSSIPIPQDIYSDIIYDGVLQVLNDEAQVQHIEFLCSTTRDPGLHFESFTNAISNTRVIYISYIDRGTVADRVEVFQRGDVVLEINGHSLARVSIERVRYENIIIKTILNDDNDNNNNNNTE